MSYIQIFCAAILIFVVPATSQFASNNQFGNNFGNNRCDPSTEVYNPKCNAHCEPTCTTSGALCSRTFTTQQRICNPKCNCKPGFVRQNQFGPCIPQNQCSGGGSPGSGQYRPLNGQTNFPQNILRFQNVDPGFAPNIPNIQPTFPRFKRGISEINELKHRLKRQIRPADGLCVKYNEVYQECGTRCPKVCGEHSGGECALRCLSGCFCKSGYIRSRKNGPCIKESDCKRKH